MPGVSCKTRWRDFGSDGTVAMWTSIFTSSSFAIVISGSTMAISADD